MTKERARSSTNKIVPTCAYPQVIQEIWATVRTAMTINEEPETVMTNKKYSIFHEMFGKTCKFATRFSINILMCFV